jgi:hypothetical protein
MFDLLRLWSGFLHRFLRSRQSLLIENLALRQQLAVFDRSRETSGTDTVIFAYLAGSTVPDPESHP